MGSARLGGVPVLRVRAYHPESGNVLTGDATALPALSGMDYSLVPDGLLEAVIVRGGIWQVTVLPE